MLPAEPASAPPSLHPRLRHLAWAALVVGLLLRLVPLLIAPSTPLGTCDGRAYWSLAISLVEGDGLTVTDPLVDATCSGVDFGPSHHFAPLLPLIEAPFVALLGPTVPSVVIPILLLSFGAVAVVWATTRDLYGPDAGLLAAAAVSVEWTGVFFGTYRGYAENLVLLTIVLTFWGIVRSLRHESDIVAAGAFAGLGYLSKASVGWFFLIAGTAGFLWRSIYHGRRALLNRWYLLAIGVFGAFVVLWATRNLLLFWDGTGADFLTAWQTSAYTADTVATAFGNPLPFALGLLGKLPILLVGLLLPFVGLTFAIRRSMADWRREDVSVLYLGVATIFALGWFFAGAFWVVERTDFLWADPVRYLAPAQVPMLWLALRTPSNAATLTGWAALYAVSAAAAISAILFW